jgi:hypothetical protein
MILVYRVQQTGNATLESTAWLQAPFSMIPTEPTGNRARHVARSGAMRAAILEERA